MNGVANALGQMGNSSAQSAGGSFSAFIPGIIVLVVLYFISKALLKNKLNFGIFSIVLGVLGSVFMLTQTKTFLGIRYIGTLEKGIQIDNTGLLIIWISIAGFILNGIYFIIVSFQKGKFEEKKDAPEHADCPMCGESILCTAIKCKHCQHLLSQEEINNIRVS